MHKLFSFFICVMVSLTLFGMDMDYNFVFKDIILPNVCLDYDAQRTFAMLATKYNQVIEDTYRPDKKRIESAMQAKNIQMIPGHIAWNQDFRRSAWVDIQPIKNNRKSWKLVLVGVADNGLIVERYKKYNGFYFPAIADNARPFFDKAGWACFYGYTDWYYNCPSIATKSVVEFSINFDGKVEGYRCFFQTGEHVHDEFFFILNFPALVKAFLQSTQRKCKRFDTGEIIKLYHVDGAYFPDDYKMFKKRLDDASDKEALQYKLMHEKSNPKEYASYDALPEMLRNSIDGQYEKQRRAKKENK